VLLAGQEDEAHESAKGIDQSDDLGRQATARAPDGLIFSPPCMGILMSSVFHRGFPILSIPMFDQRDHPSVPTMNMAGHGGGRRSRMARRATAEGGAQRP
jgi:hypothetical protein